MAEYIAREVLLAQLRAMESYNASPMYRRGYDDCVEAILKAPAADVAPVVRCGDCKHWKKLTGVNGYCACAVGLREADLSDCFCSYGERRDGGADNETD